MCFLFMQLHFYLSIQEICCLKYFKWLKELKATKKYLKRLKKLQTSISKGSLKFRLKQLKPWTSFIFRLRENAINFLFEYLTKNALSPVQSKR